MDQNQRKIHRCKTPFLLENGRQIQGLELAYHTFGTINNSQSNVVWICHALTANSNPTEWWPELVGSGHFFDPSKYFIICVNMPASCYGSTGPLSYDVKTGKPHYNDFPLWTIRDMVNSFEALRRVLGIEKINYLVGGSMGGQQALEWSLILGEKLEKLVLLATNAKHSPWGIAFNETQRMAIETDPEWGKPDPKAALNGMKTARAIALMSYRHYDTYLLTQQEEEQDYFDQFRASSYQRYQGEKLAQRFNAYSYWYLSKAMDSHHMGRNRGGIKEVLQSISVKTLILGLLSDQLFPIEEQRYLARHLANAELVELNSSFGHDGFLLEANQIKQALQNFK